MHHCFAIMDYTQKDCEECAGIKQSCDANEDEVLKIPKFSWMERFFVIGGKDPCFFYKKIMEIAYPPKTKKSSNIFKDLKLNTQNNEWQKETNGLFGREQDIRLA